MSASLRRKAEILPKQEARSDSGTKKRRTTVNNLLTTVSMFEGVQKADSKPCLHPDVDSDSCTSPTVQEPQRPGAPKADEIQFPSPKEYEQAWELSRNSGKSQEPACSKLTPIFREILEMENSSTVQGYEEKRGVVIISLDEQISDEDFRKQQKSIEDIFQKNGIHDVVLVFERSPTAQAQHKSGNQVAAKMAVQDGGKEISLKTGKQVNVPLNGCPGTVGLMIHKHTVKPPTCYMYVSTCAHIILNPTEAPIHPSGRSYPGDQFICAGRVHEGQQCQFHGPRSNEHHTITCGQAGGVSNTSVALFQPETNGFAALDVMAIPMSSLADHEQALEEIEEDNLIEVKVFKMPQTDFTSASMIKELGGNMKIAVYLNSQAKVLKGEITSVLKNRILYVSGRPYMYEGLIQYRLDETRSPNGDVVVPHPQPGDSGSPLLRREKGNAHVQLIGLHVGAADSVYCYAVWAEPNLQVIQGQTNLYVPAEVDEVVKQMYP